MRSDRRTSILVVVFVFSSLLAAGRDDGGGGYHLETRPLKPLGPLWQPNSIPHFQEFQLVTLISENVEFEMKLVGFQHL